MDSIKLRPEKSVCPLKDIYNMVNRSDTEVIALIKSRSDAEQGYRLLISQYKEPLYWHIRRMVKNHDDADDILQNTFIKVFKNIEQFKQESSLKTWLYRIATNESISFLNNLKNQGFDPLESVQHEGAMEDLVDYDDIHSKLNKAIDTLPAKQKAVFVMRYYDEMPYQDIAQITGTSEGSLKASFHLAVKKIETYLKS